MSKLLTIILLFITLSCKNNRDSESFENSNTNSPAKLLAHQADSLYKNKSFYSALVLYEKLIVIDSLNGEFNFRLGYCYVQNNEHSKATKYYHKTINLDYRKFESYRNLGLIYGFVLNDKKNAIDCFNKCLSINPDSKEIKDFLLVLKKNSVNNL
ncbi:MAG: tetratricopeptide repeat protein [Cyclobacteriaceae bacterium]|jgi:tetratricopeptide (TPR) repeat protein|nr:hypothetical protein [Flammeovirgaceae bacterium]